MNSFALTLPLIRILPLIHWKILLSNLAQNADSGTLTSGECIGIIIHVYGDAGGLMILVGFVAGGFSAFAFWAFFVLLGDVWFNFVSMCHINEMSGASMGIFIDTFFMSRFLSNRIHLLENLSKRASTTVFWASFQIVKLR